MLLHSEYDEIDAVTEKGQQANTYIPAKFQTDYGKKTVEVIEYGLQRPRFSRCKHMQEA